MRPLMIMCMCVLSFTAGVVTCCDVVVWTPWLLVQVMLWLLTLYCGVGTETGWVQFTSNEPLLTALSVSCAGDETDPVIEIYNYCNPGVTDN